MWSKRYDQINDFERMLSENGVRIVKFLLYISKDEQAERFRERLDDQAKNWKFSPADIKEREYWDEYIEAYQDMLEQMQHRMGAVVRDSGQPQVVPQPGGFARSCGRRWRAWI